MSKINFSRNIFLEKEELNKFQEFLSESGALGLLKAATITYGIVKISSEDPFATTVASTNSVNVSGGNIFNSSGEFVKAYNQQITFTSPGTYWLKLSPNPGTSYEPAFFSLSSTGQLTTQDSSYKLDSVLRGQEFNVPVSVKFFTESSGTLSPAYEGQIFEVQSVNPTANTAQLISGLDSISALSGLRMVVLGTVPLNYEYSSVQLEGLYSYNYYNIVSVAATSQPTLGVDEYFVSKVVVNSDGQINNIQDLRSNFWTFGQINFGGDAYVISDVNDFNNIPTGVSSVLIMPGVYNLVGISGLDFGDAVVEGIGEVTILGLSLNTSGNFLAKAEGFENIHFGLPNSDGRIGIHKISNIDLSLIQHNNYFRNCSLCISISGESGVADNNSLFLLSSPTGSSGYNQHRIENNYFNVSDVASSFTGKCYVMGSGCLFVQNNVAYRGLGLNNFSWSDGSIYAGKNVGAVGSTSSAENGWNTIDAVG